MNIKLSHQVYAVLYNTKWHRYMYTWITDMLFTNSVVVSVHTFNTQGQKVEDIYFPPILFVSTFSHLFYHVRILWPWSEIQKKLPTPRGNQIAVGYHQHWPTSNMKESAYIVKFTLKMSSISWNGKYFLEYNVHWMKRYDSETKSFWNDELRGVNLNYQAVAIQTCYLPYFRPFKSNGRGTWPTMWSPSASNVGTYIHIWHVIWPKQKDA